MSIGSLPGIASSVAGAPLAQAKAEVERTSLEVGAQQRQVMNQLKAETAAGIGETDGQDHEASERDADGRRLWERGPEKHASPTSEDTSSPPHQSIDTTGQAGNLLDLSG